MARKKRISNWENFKLRTRSSLNSGVLALLLIVGLFLLLNNFTNTTRSENGNNHEQKQEEKQPETKIESQTNQPQTYVVVPGDNLSKIAEKYFDDKEQWKLLAAENQIADPDQIEVGQTLTIPNLESQTSSLTTQASSSEAQDSQETVNEPNIYTVLPGDTLWEISQQFYSGDGYQWFRIRDANPTKVGLLPNGRPLIAPGTVLIIPLT